MPAVAGDSPAVKVAVFGALAYDIVSAVNSSPQTTELNAAQRSATLMKWVVIAECQIAGFAVLGVLLDGTLWPAVGAVIGGGLMWAQYVHAKNAGLRSSLPGTETYAPPAARRW